MLFYADQKPDYAFDDNDDPILDPTYMYIFDYISLISESSEDFNL